MRMRWAGFAMSASGYSAISRGALGSVRLRPVRRERLSPEKQVAALQLGLEATGFPPLIVAALMPAWLASVSQILSGRLGLLLSPRAGVRPPPAARCDGSRDGYGDDISR